MKFSQLYSERLGDCDWPQIHYNELKAAIKLRRVTGQTASTSETAHFKYSLWCDLTQVSEFWQFKEQELQAIGRAMGGNYGEEPRRMLTWLMLNYLATLKITKKHDKHCGTQLMLPVSKVLMLQPFVVGLLTCSLFTELLAGLNQRHSTSSEDSSSEQDRSPEARRAAINDKFDLWLDTAVTKLRAASHAENQEPLQAASLAAAQSELLGDDIDIVAAKFAHGSAAGMPPAAACDSLSPPLLPVCVGPSGEPLAFLPVGSTDADAAGRHLQSEYVRHMLAHGSASGLLPSAGGSLLSHAMLPGGAGDVAANVAAFSQPSPVLPGMSAALQPNEWHEQPLAHVGGLPSVAGLTAELAAGLAQPPQLPLPTTGGYSSELLAVATAGLQPDGLQPHQLPLPSTVGPPPELLKAPPTLLHQDGLSPAAAVPVSAAPPHGWMLPTGMSSPSMSLPTGGLPLELLSIQESLRASPEASPPAVASLPTPAVASLPTPIAQSMQHFPPSAADARPPQSLGSALLPHELQPVQRMPLGADAGPPAEIADLWS